MCSSLVPSNLWKSSADATLFSARGCCLCACMTHNAQYAPQLRTGSAEVITCMHACMCDLTQSNGLMANQDTQSHIILVTSGPRVLASFMRICANGMTAFFSSWSFMSAREGSARICTCAQMRHEMAPAHMHESIALAYHRFKHVDLTMQLKCTSTYMHPSVALNIP